MPLDPQMRVPGVRPAGPAPLPIAGAVDGLRRYRSVSRGLIVDLEDTLFPRESYLRSAFAAVARHLSATADLDAGDAYGVLVRARLTGERGRELQALCARFGFPPAYVPALVDVMRTHVPSIALSHGAPFMLRQLRQLGWRIAVLTNGRPDQQARTIAALRLEALVDEVVFAEAHAPGGKPAAEPFLAALARLRVPAARCVCVGDDPIDDIAGAARVGLRTIRLARPGAVHAGVDADLVVDALHTVPVAATSLLAGVMTDAA